MVLSGESVSIICELLERYKTQRRVDLELQQVSAGFPNFLYYDAIPENKVIMNKAIDYRKSRSFAFHMIDVQ